ncbi:MAG: class I SAM-dependent methyltransferase [Candidatus Eremiobacteraeota bacterium]|nr:class I SAM-dependent methyltransferase [Candidatus Eremiobacteraeota bacterium]MBV9056064.1 class I SAM-dependent methyltransferase [Candidatus Eremiobacteraeota bacterium]MBV9699523.1 class I SAM-dependent methyltransferase [Candidatus Eremiobacteraeota bacterium]
MADESMVRNLDAQARAIWPQELPLFARYALPPEANILDAGCGTGEISSRIAELYPQARVLGVDIVDEHLALARARYARLAGRLRFEHQSVFDLALGDEQFDLVLCRHVLHSIPQMDRVINELLRVTRTGGYIHLIPEDYGMLHFQSGEPDPRDFWHEVPATMGPATGVDLFAGRNVYGVLRRLGLVEIKVDYVIVDTLRTERETFAAILEAWRDGYAGPIGEVTAVTEESAIAYFNAMIVNVRDPQKYAVWMLPVVSGQKACACPAASVAPYGAEAVNQSKPVAASAPGAA